MIPHIVKSIRLLVGARIIYELSWSHVEVASDRERVLTRANEGSCASALAIYDDGFEEPSKVAHVGLPCSSILSRNGKALRRARLCHRRPKIRLQPLRRVASVCSCSRRGIRIPSSAAIAFASRHRVAVAGAPAEVDIKHVHAPAGLARFSGQQFTSTCPSPPSTRAYNVPSQKEVRGT